MSYIYLLEVENYYINRNDSRLYTFKTLEEVYKCLNGRYNSFMIDGGEKTIIDLETAKEELDPEDKTIKLYLDDPDYGGELCKAFAIFKIKIN